LKTPFRPARIAVGLAAGIAGGALCAWIGTPLPWMIGPLFAMATLKMWGVDARTLPGGRDAGMLVVGTSLGLYFTLPVLREVSTYWPWFVFLGFAAIAYGAASALLLMRLAGVDRATAYFGSMPGGAADMAMIGERFGAMPDRVAFAHSVRMMMVVTLIPAGITLAGFSATEDYRPVRVPFDAGGLVILLALNVAAGSIARRLKAPTAFTMGPLVLTTVMTAAGLELSSVPTWMTNVAQVLLGLNLGSRFERSFLAVAPRFAAALLPSIALMLGLAAGVGWAISATSGAYLGTALLAAAPGGIAEMTITAKVLRIGVAFVTAAHVVRYLIVVLFNVPMFHLLERARRKVAE
jgi:uncharacterized protein